MKIDLERLDRLRQSAFFLIDRELEQDGHHKSYEGAVSIHLGNRWDEHSVYFELHCYVAPGGRHHTFDTLDEFEVFLAQWAELQRKDEEAA